MAPDNSDDGADDKPLKTHPDGEEFVDIEIPGPPEGVVYPTLAYKDVNKGISSTHSIDSKTRRHSQLPFCGINCSRIFRNRIRYLILVIVVLCMTSTRSNELSFNFTVICMTSNSTLNDDPVPMTAKETSTIFAGAGIGAVAMVIPIVYTLHYFGSRLTFTAVLLCSGFATIALSPLAHQGALWMLPARIFQGLALSAVMPLMGAISAEWSPLAEIGQFMTILSCAGQLSQIITMPLSAQLCVTAGWPSVYYVHGVASIVLAFMFFAFYRSSPQAHPCIHPDEIKRIGREEYSLAKKGHKVPYYAIATSRPVWGIWIAFLGNSFGFQLIVQFMPTFLNKVLGMPITRTGMSAVVPPATQLVVKMLAGWICDKITFIPERRKLQIYNTIAMCGCGIFLLPLGFISAETAHLALLCFTASISCLGLVACGSMKSATLIARSYTHFVMAVVQLVVCIGMLLVPFLVSMLAPNNTVEQWRYVFIVVFFVLFFSNIAFCCLCSAVPEPWALTHTAIAAAELEGLRQEETERTTVAVVNA